MTTYLTYPRISCEEYAAVVRAIEAGDPKGQEDLYRLFHKGLRYYFVKQLGPKCSEDILHEAFVAVVKAVRKGELREPARLPGFVRTVARRQVIRHIEAGYQARRTDDASRLDDIEKHIQDHRVTSNPEVLAIIEQQARLLRTALAELTERDRQILELFYLQNQTEEQIREVMFLTETQFRLMKSRAKDKLTKRCRELTSSPVPGTLKWLKSRGIDPTKGKRGEPNHGE